MHNSIFWRPQKHSGLANRHRVVLYQDNARSQFSVNTLQELKGFGWDILNHPPYSLDIAPSDYYMFH